MVHKFDVKNRNKLDNAERRSILPPEKTIASFNLGEGDIMADIGCGIGYFTIPASKIVGKSGRIFAMDISPEMLEEVKIKINQNDISNVETVLTQAYDLKIEDNKISFAFMSTILHEIEDKEKFLKEVKRIICPKGKIAIVDWQKINGKFGPPIEHRLDKMDVVKMLETLGFLNVSTVYTGENFYGLIAEKQ